MPGSILSESHLAQLLNLVSCGIQKHIHESRPTVAEKQTMVVVSDPSSNTCPGCVTTDTQQSAIKIRNNLLAFKLIISFNHYQ